MQQAACLTSGSAAAKAAGAGLGARLQSPASELSRWGRFGDCGSFMFMAF